MEPSKATEEWLKTWGNSWFIFDNNITSWDELESAKKRQSSQDASPKLQPQLSGDLRLEQMVWRDVDDDSEVTQLNCRKMSNINELSNMYDSEALLNMFKSAAPALSRDSDRHSEDRGYTAIHPDIFNLPTESTLNSPLQSSYHVEMEMLQDKMEENDDDIESSSDSESATECGETTNTAQHALSNAPKYRQRCTHCGYGKKGCDAEMVGFPCTRCRDSGKGDSCVPGKLARVKEGELSGLKTSRNHQHGR